MSVPSSWEQTSWGQVAGLKYGKALRDYRDSGGAVPVFGTNGPVGFTTRPQAQGPGVIIGRKGAYRGVHFSPSDFWVIDTAFYLDPVRPLDMRWAYYALLLADINGLDSGSAIPSTTRESFASLSVIYPPLPEQQAIAEVLGAFDDKIAANTRLAAAADDLARASFDATIRSGAPELVVLDEIAQIVLGGTPSRARPEYWANGTVGWINSGSANATRVVTPDELITEEALANSAAKLMPKCATVIAITGATLGQVARLEIETSGNQSLVGIWHEDRGTNDWLYFAVQSRIPELMTYATGAAQQHVSKRDVEALTVPMPSPDGIRDFAQTVSPLLGRASLAEFENRTLAETRDALLPHLMSGKLRVCDAEAIASEAGV